MTPGSASGNAVGAGPEAGIVPVAQGGTGKSTAAAGYNALSPMTTTGDLGYKSGHGYRFQAGQEHSTQKQY